MDRSPRGSSVSKAISARLRPEAVGSLPSPWTQTTRVRPPVKARTSAPGAATGAGVVLAGAGGVPAAGDLSAAGDVRASAGGEGREHATRPAEATTRTTVAVKRLQTR